MSIVEHLSEGNSIKGTARLTRADASTVRRLNRKSGQHGERFHDETVQDVSAKNLQADERHGYAGNKRQPAWEAEVIDPISKFVISHVQGVRDEHLIRRLLTDAASRVSNPHQIALFTDGFASYKTLFPQIFGYSYRPARQGNRGRFPKLRYRIPRSAAHVRIIKHRQGQQLTAVTIDFAHGSQKRIRQALLDLGFRVPNTSIIERRNGTARLMNATQTRKTLAFAKRDDTKCHRGWWALTVYNWCRPHRSLRQPLPHPIGKKRYAQRSPAKALGLADFIFSQAQILLSPVYPKTGWR